MSNARNLSDLLGTGSTVATAKIDDAVFNANKNLVINGGMNVASRGTSSTAANYKTVDRFQNSRSTDGGVTQSQTALTSGSPYDEGFRNVYRQTMSTASSTPAADHYLTAIQIIEASTDEGSIYPYGGVRITARVLYEFTRGSA